MSFALVCLLAAVPAPAPQHGATSAPPSGNAERGLGEVRHIVPGTVKDLTRDNAGRILYCTAEREVGRLDPGGGRTVLATAASGPFPNELRALAEISGHIAVLDSAGHVRVLFNSVAPATVVYNDLYMVGDPSDLIVDARGNFLIASATPSSGQRAVNWVQSDGQRWCYYLVKHQPLQLAADPLTGGFLMSETTDGGNVQLVQAGSPIHATTAIDSSTHPGLTVSQSDGDLALESNGDFYWIAGGSVYRHSRATHTTSLFAGGFGPLHGVVIAAASGFVPGSAAWSLYVAEGANPTRIREISGAGTPAILVANDQGEVPDRGTKVNVTFGFQAFDLAADNDGRLLLGGTNFGNQYMIKRVTLTGTPSIATLATAANGLAGIVEGLCVANDDSIYALTREGLIQHITEGPLAITTVYSDPSDRITAGKDLALDVDGTLYVACREAWDFGKILGIGVGGVNLLHTTEETRGLAANPAGGMLFSQWHDTGFHGSVDLLHFADNSIENLPGFKGMNFTNDYVWGDGDICVDADGSIYTVSEDDWSLVRYDAALDGCVRIGSSYLNHPSGLAIAPSTASSGSTTGWSLYVSEFNNLWEKPSVPPPAPTLVDASLGLRVGRTLAGTPHPRYGKPSVLAPAPVPGGTVVWIGTKTGWLLALDTSSGAIEPLVGPDQGLQGELVALASSSDGRRVVALNADGLAFELSGGRVRPLSVEPEVAAAALARVRAAPQRFAQLRDPWTRTTQWFALDGWSVWRATAPR